MLRLNESPFELQVGDIVYTENKLNGVTYLTMSYFLGFVAARDSNNEFTTMQAGNYFLKYNTISPVNVWRYVKNCTYTMLFYQIASVAPYETPDFKLLTDEPFDVSYWTKLDNVILDSFSVDISYNRWPDSFVEKYGKLVDIQYKHDKNKYVEKHIDKIKKLFVQYNPLSTTEFKSYYTVYCMKQIEQYLQYTNNVMANVLTDVTRCELGTLAYVKTAKKIQLYACVGHDKKTKEPLFATFYGEHDYRTSLAPENLNTPKWLYCLYKLNEGKLIFHKYVSKMILLNTKAANPIIDGKYLDKLKERVIEFN